jgi:hypothetical protein
MGVESDEGQRLHGKRVTREREETFREILGSGAGARLPRYRDKQINFRVSADEAERFDRVAAHYGIALAAMLRMLVKERDDEIQSSRGALLRVVSPLLPSQRSAAKAKAKESYAQVTERLADAHRSRDSGIDSIWSFPDPGGRTVRLVEVTDSVPFGGPLLPFRFPARGVIAFPSTVILVHPNDWKRIEAGKLKLPRGWDLKTRHLIASVIERPGRS